VISLLGVVALAAPAQAAKPANPGGSDKPAKPAKAAKASKPSKQDSAKRRCTPRAVGFNAAGTLMSATLTVAEPRRYDGTLVVDVKRANHGAPKGEQTYTLDGARVMFRRGVDAAAPAAGSRVRLHGTITRLAKRCSAEGFTPTVTVRRVEISMPRPAAPAPSPEEPEEPAPAAPPAAPAGRSS